MLACSAGPHHAPVISIFDVFVDFVRLAGKRKGKDAKPEASAAPFKQASPMKKAPAAQGGTFYGTIGGKIPYEPVRLTHFAFIWLPLLSHVLTLLHADQIVSSIQHTSLHASR